MTAEVRGPLTAVLAEVAAGTPTVAEMARNTGLSQDVLRAGLDHLVRTGRLQATQMPIGCPASGCGSCQAAGGCGAAAGGKHLVSLSLTRA